MKSARVRSDEALQRGLRLFAVQRYVEAIAAVQEAYLLTPRAELLYALGQAQRYAHDCHAAIESYRRFIKSGPAARQVEAAQRNIERCETTLSHPPPGTDAAALLTPPPSVRPPPDAAPVVERPVAITTPTRRPPPRALWWTGGVLVGVGLAAVGTGGALAGIARARSDELASASTYDQFAARTSAAYQAEGWQGPGIATAIVGASLVVGGTVALTIAARRAGGAR